MVCGCVAASGCEESSATAHLACVLCGCLSGEIDFWVDSNLRWGIELTRGGSKVREHLDRGADQGKYKPLDPAAYRVVDFRWDTQVRTDDAEYIAVLVNPDCKLASIRIQGRDPVIIKFTGQRPGCVLRR